MKLKFALVIVLGIALVFVKYGFDKTPTVAAKDGRFLLANVNVIDVERGVVLPGQDVLLSGHEIARISAHGSHAIPKDAQVIQASSKYLMPGLWDMHTHSWKRSPELHHPLFIAFGVTTVRDLSGCLSKDDPFWACPQDRKNWTKLLEQGASLSPRYIEQSSYQTNGGNEVPSGFPAFFKLDDQRAAQQLIAFYQEQGVSSIKPYSELSQAQYLNLVQAAKAQGLKVAGHRPIAVSLDKVLELEQDSVEHARLFLFACHARAEEFARLSDPIAAYTSDYIRSMLDERDLAACSFLMQRMSKSKTWWTPTLTTLAMGAYASTNAAAPSEHSKYIPWLVKALLWNPDRRNTLTKGVDQNGRYVHMDAFKQAQDDVKRAHDFGVKILAGTDSTDTDVYSGISLHRELAWMVEAGLSPAQALKTATYNSAVYAGLLASSGTIEVGKRADLVLLTANPLERIANTQTIDAVFINGQYLSTTDLDKLRRYAQQMAGNIALNALLLWDMLASPLWRVQLID